MKKIFFITLAFALVSSRSFADDSKPKLIRIVKACAPSDRMAFQNRTVLDALKGAGPKNYSPRKPTTTIE